MWVRGSPTQRTGARRTSFPATIRQTYKSDGGPNYPWSGMQDMITVKTLARAIEKRLGGTGSEALAEARTVMSYFGLDRKSTRLNSSHRCISYAVFCLKKKKNNQYTK